MSNLKQVERLQRMHRLIKFKRTGTPEEFARRMGISRANLFIFLKELRNLGGPLQYNSVRQTYYYTQNVELQIGYVTHSGTAVPVEPPQLAKVSGGAVVRYLRSGGPDLGTAC